MLGSAARVAGSTPEAKPAEPDKIIRRAYSIASASVERRNKSIKSRSLIA